MKSFITLLGWTSAQAVGVMAGASFPPVPHDVTTPTQQRIGIKGPKSVAVGWNTYQPLHEPCVDYGFSSFDLEYTACSLSSVTYPSSRTWANTVTLDDLRPGTTYYYKIRSTNSTVEHFLSPRPAGDRGSFSFNAITDLGVYGEDGFTLSKTTSVTLSMTTKAKRDIIPTIDPSLNHTTIARLANTIDDYEFLVQPGDIGYADDWLLTPKNLFEGADAYAAITEQFFQQLAPITGRKAYMVGPGNHDATCQQLPLTSIFCPDGQRNFTDFVVRFAGLMPTAFPSRSDNDTARSKANLAQLLGNPPFWYSFEYGMVHFTMINTETDFFNAPDGPGGSSNLDSGPFGMTESHQLAFLEADFASVDRKQTPWLIVLAHRPWYTTSGGLPCDPCQDAFEPLMFKYGVDLAIFGHQHSSQRFLPVNKGVPDPKGMHDPDAPMYIVSGGAGNIEGMIPVGVRQSFNAFLNVEDFGYARTTLLDENNLRVQFINSATGEIMDESVLFKSHTERFVIQ